MHRFKKGEVMPGCKVALLDFMRGVMHSMPNYLRKYDSVYRRLLQTGHNISRSAQLCLGRGFDLGFIADFAGEFESNEFEMMARSRCYFLLFDTLGYLVPQLDAEVHD